MNDADKQTYNLLPNAPACTKTNFCHIFPPSTKWGFNPNDPDQKKVRFFSYIVSYCHLTYYRKNTQETSGVLSIASGVLISSASLTEKRSIASKMDLLWMRRCIVSLMTSIYGLITLQ